MIQYVSQSGSDAADGLSWQTARRSVKTAIGALPLGTATDGTIVHRGSVIVGPGTFVEEPMPLVGDRLHIKGQGTHQTIIKLADGSDTHLFSEPDGFTEYNHHVIFESLTLDGNKANNEAGDLLRFTKGGFNHVVRDVLLQNAAGFGARYLYNAVNAYWFNYGGAGCEEGFLHVYLEKGSNNLNLGMWGGQIDNCGYLAPIQIESDTGGNTLNVLIHGLETESIFDPPAHHQYVIYVANRGANAIGIDVRGVSAYQKFPDADTQAVLYEASGKSQWSFSGIRGYPVKFKSEALGKQYNGHITMGFANQSSLWVDGALVD